jgi:hypothetical protein
MIMHEVLTRVHKRTCADPEESSDEGDTDDVAVGAGAGNGKGQAVSASGKAKAQALPRVCFSTSGRSMRASASKALEYFASLPE